MAARAFICYDKFSDYDRNREAFEGYWDFNYGLDKNYRDAYEMLGLDLKEDCNWRAIVQHVKTAEAEGRSPFILPEPATAVAWREALHPATTAKRLMELAGKSRVGCRYASATRARTTGHIGTPRRCARALGHSFRTMRLGGKLAPSCNRRRAGGPSCCRPSRELP